MPGKQKLLLIGCGDIPTRLLSKLNSADWNIQGLRRSKVELAEVEMSYGDAADSEIINALIQEQPDHVILTLTPDGRTAEDYRNTYLKPAQIAAKAVQKWAPNCHLIFVSSTSVYGQNSGVQVNEDSLTEPSSATAQVLLEAEKQIAQCGNPWSVIRFSGIYGPGRERLLHKVRSGNFTEPDSAGWTNRIHSEDCAGALAHLLENTNADTKAAGLLIATDSAPVLNTEVEKWLAGEMGIEYPDFDKEEVLAKGKRCSNRKLLDSGFRFMYPSYREGYRELMRSL